MELTGGCLPRGLGEIARDGDCPMVTGQDAAVTGQQQASLTNSQTFLSDCPDNTTTLQVPKQAHSLF